MPQWSTQSILAFRRCTAGGTARPGRARRSCSSSRPHPRVGETGRGRQRRSAHWLRRTSPQVSGGAWRSRGRGRGRRRRRGAGACRSSLGARLPRMDDTSSSSGLCAGRAMPDQRRLRAGRPRGSVVARRGRKRHDAAGQPRGVRERGKEELGVGAAVVYGRRETHRPLFHLPAALCRVVGRPYRVPPYAAWSPRAAPAATPPSRCPLPRHRQRGREELGVGAAVVYGHREPRQPLLYLPAAVCRVAGRLYRAPPCAARSPRAAPSRERERTSPAACIASHGHRELRRPLLHLPAALCRVAGRPYLFKACKKVGPSHLVSTEIINLMGVVSTSK